MSEYESMDRNSADASVPQPTDYPPPPSTPISEGGPHHQADPHQAVARMPDLGRSERDVHSERPKRRHSRRREGMEPSVKLFIGAGVLLVAAVGVMMLFNRSKETDVSDNQEPTGWEIPAPRPDAPLAPAWQGPGGETAGWQSQDNLANYGQADPYQADRSWNSTPPAAQSIPWSEQPMGVQADGSALSGQTQPGAWDNQPEARGWDSRQDAAATPGQSQWGAVDTQAQAYPQPQAYRAAPSGSTSRQSASTGQVRPDPSPWNVDVPAVPVQSMTGVPSRQAELSPRIGRDMGVPPARSSYTDRQTGVYRGEPESAPPIPARRDPYQTAPSAQNDTRAMGVMTSDNSYQSRECCPPTGTAAYPAYRAAPVTRQEDPAAIARRDDYRRDYRTDGTGAYRSDDASSYRAGGTSTYRSGGTSTYSPGGTSSYRSGGTDTYRRETASRQAPVGAMGSGPAASYRPPYPNNIPSTSERVYQSPPNRYGPTNGQPAGTAGASNYPAPNTGASTLYPQSGTARFTGEIEKPTARTTYDYTRSSLY